MELVGKLTETRKFLAGIKNLIWSHSKVNLNFQKIDNFNFCEKKMASCKLRTSDGHDVPVKNESIPSMKKVNEIWSKSETQDEQLIRVDVNRNTLDQILYWISHHKRKNSVEDDDDDDENVVEEQVEVLDCWNQEFFAGLGLGNVFQLTLAAIYLDIPELINATCKFIAQLLKSKSIEEIRVLFDV